LVAAAAGHEKISVFIRTVLEPYISARPDTPTPTLRRDVDTILIAQRLITWLGHEYGIAANDNGRSSSLSSNPVGLFALLLSLEVALREIRRRVQASEKSQREQK
jgi:hypothetical protein